MGTDRSPAVLACPHCGYDLRGIESVLCPECGLSFVRTPLMFLDRNEFIRAVAALERAGIAATPIDPIAGPFGAVGIFGGPPSLYQIDVDGLDLDHVEATLDTADIPMRIPIVDRAEPLCPTCESELTETAVCRRCHRQFEWVESHDADGEGPQINRAVSDAAGDRGGPADTAPRDVMLTAVAAALLSPVAWALPFIPQNPVFIYVGSWLALFALTRLVRRHHGNRR